METIIEIGSNKGQDTEKSIKKDGFYIWNYNRRKT